MGFLYIIFFYNSLLQIDVEPTSRVSSMAVGQELWVDLKNSVWCEYVVIVSQKLNSFDLSLSVKPKFKGRAVVLRNRERRKLFCHLGIDTERNQTQFQPNRFYCFHYIGLISNFANQMDFVPNSKSFVSSDSSRQNTRSSRFFRWTL